MRRAASIAAFIGDIFHSAGKRVLIGVLCLVVNLNANSSFAQDTVDPSKVRIAYLYHFLRFTEWPIKNRPSRDQSYSICIPKLTSSNEFLGLIRQKTVNGQPIEIRHVDANDSLASCQILYLAELSTDLQRRYIDLITDLSVLSVGSGNAFLDAGGIIAFNVRGGELTFSVNLTRANQADLKISANMLDVAERVIM